MKKRGKGVACMLYPVAFTEKRSPSSVFLKVNHDATVHLYFSPVDWGQGAITAISQIVGEVLGINPENIRVVTSDTDITPFDSHGTCASRVTYVVGNAAKKAAESAQKLLLQAAAYKLGLISPDRLIIKDGEIFEQAFPTRKISVKDAAWSSERELGKPVIAAESFTTLVYEIDKETGQGKPYETYTFGTQIAEVEVDTETGEVDVLRITAVHDCGKAINPLMVEGQIEGGVVMGVGYALTEELLEDKKQGGVINSSFVDYVLPTALDTPREIIAGFVEEPDEGGPFGAKGIAEPTQLPTAPAIINAIYDAVGVRIYDLPATPEKILKALRRRRDGSSAS